jgi:hypothetical protein
MPRDWGRDETSYDQCFYEELTVFSSHYNDIMSYF